MIDKFVYLESLKEYRDWYAVLDTAERKGFEKAQELIEKVQKEKEKAQKEKEKAIKREEKAQKEKEKAQEEKKKAQEEKKKAQEEKEKLLEEKKESVINFLNIGLSKEQISKAMKLSIEEIEKIIKGK